jgi:hypothetical protein
MHTLTGNDAATLILSVRQHMCRRAARAGILGPEHCHCTTLRGVTMSYARQILDTYRQPLAVDAGLLAAAIDAASDCAQACAADTDADLNESDLAEMVTCIRLCLDCTDICTATAAVLSRPAEHDLNATRLLVGACAAICQTCGDECERHAHMPVLRP